MEGAIVCQGTTEITTAVADCGQWKEVGVGALRFRALDAVPRQAIPRREKKVLFIEIECGEYWELEAEEIFELPKGNVVVVLKEPTTLKWDEGVAEIILGAGTWLRV